MRNFKFHLPIIDYQFISNQFEEIEKNTVKSYYCNMLFAILTTLKHDKIKAAFTVMFCLCIE